MTPRSGRTGHGSRKFDTSSADARASGLIRSTGDRQSSERPLVSETLPTIHFAPVDGRSAIIVYKRSGGGGGFAAPTAAEARNGRAASASRDRPGAARIRALARPLSADSGIHLR